MADFEKAHFPHAAAKSGMNLHASYAVFGADEGKVDRDALDV